MWIDYIENDNYIGNLYNYKTPKIDDVIIEEVVIETNEYIQLLLRFEISQMPDEMPTEWKEENYDRFIIVLMLKYANIKSIFINGNNFRNVNIDISEINHGLKRIIGKNKLGELIFEFEAKNIFIDNILGYNYEDSLTII